MITTNTERTMEENKGQAGLMHAMTDTLVVSKKNATDVANEIRARVQDRRIDLLSVYERLQFLGEVAAAFGDDATRAQVLEEIKARGAGTGKVVTEGGVFAERETATKYDYSGDRVWSDLNKLIAELNAQRKAREEFLKVLPATIEQEYTPIQLESAPHVPLAATRITVKPPTKSSTLGFAFTMNKG